MGARSRTRSDFSMRRRCCKPNIRWIGFLDYFVVREVFKETSSTVRCTWYVLSLVLPKRVAANAWAVYICSSCWVWNSQYNEIDKICKKTIKSHFISSNRESQNLFSRETTSKKGLGTTDSSCSNPEGKENSTWNWGLCVLLPLESSKVDGHSVTQGAKCTKANLLLVKHG